MTGTFHRVPSLNIWLPRGASSADGLRRWQWPAGVSRVTIFADAGAAGIQAAAALADRLNIADIDNEIVSPLHGDDVNDDLCRGTTAADYATPIDEPAPAPKILRTIAEFDAAAHALTNPPDLQALGSHPRPAGSGAAGATAGAPGADRDQGRHRHRQLWRHLLDPRACFVFLYGTGANGKGAFLNTLTAILGDYAGLAERFT